MPKPTATEVKARADGLYDTKSDAFLGILIDEVARQYAAVKRPEMFKDLVTLHVLCLLWAEAQATKNGGGGDLLKQRAGEVEQWYGGQKVFSGADLYASPWGFQLKQKRFQARIYGDPAVGGGPPLMQS